ncbi:MAG: family protein phosphatase, partial [Gaiellales bacterium]|nr:family protein phosphatase [Gaiellales bacterium]
MKVGQRYAETNPGRKRRRNEDSFVCDPPLFAVADGMGGAQAGEVASSLAASALKERGDGDGGDGERRVAELIQEANRRVHQRAMDDEAASGMGTTMTVALVHDDGAVTIGHVGDSRAYLLR